MCTLIIGLTGDNPTVMNSLWLGAEIGMTGVVDCTARGERGQTWTAILLSQQSCHTPRLSGIYTGIS